MRFTLSDQLITFACSLLAGLGLGLFYELLRIVRTLNSKRRGFVFFCDLMFMLVFSVVSILFSICYSKGNTRYFIVAGEFSGILFIRFTLGFFNIRFFIPLCRKTIVKFAEIVVNMGKTLKKLLQVTGVVLYNIIRKKKYVSPDRKS